MEIPIMRTLFVTTMLLAALAVRAEDDVVKTISHGEKIDLQKQFQPGKYTVVEFYADW
jgi:hypothetical protein